MTLFVSMVIVKVFGVGSPVLYLRGLVDELTVFVFEFVLAVDFEQVAHSCLTFALSGFRTDRPRVGQYRQPINDNVSVPINLCVVVAIGARRRVVIVVRLWRLPVVVDVVSAVGAFRGWLGLPVHVPVVVAIHVHDHLEGSVSQQESSRPTIVPVQILPHRLTAAQQRRLISLGQSWTSGVHHVGRG